MEATSEWVVESIFPMWGGYLGTLYFTYAVDHLPTSVTGMWMPYDDYVSVGGEYGVIYDRVDSLSDFSRMDRWALVVWSNGERTIVLGPEMADMACRLVGADVIHGNAVWLARAPYVDEVDFVYHMDWVKVKSWLNASALSLRRLSWSQLALLRESPLTHPSSSILRESSE